MEQAQTVQLGRRGFWAISLTLFMIAYNVSAVPAIMPSIVQDLNSSVGYIQSILVLFSLVTASFAPTTENLCRFYGRTRVFVIGLIVYGIGIVLTSLSPTIAGLTVSFALLTGLAATPLIIIIISAPWTIADLFCQGKAAERAILVLIVASSLGGLSGGLLGGYLASNFSWRWSFLPSLGVLLVVLLLRRSLPKLAVPSHPPIDWVGGLLSFLGLGSILLGVSLAGEFGWWEPKRLFSVAGLVIPPFQLSIVPTLLAVGIIILGFFGFWQRRQADQCGASLLRAGLLRKRGFVFGVLTSMLHVLITTGVQFNLYQFVPTALLLNPFRTALTVIPYNLTMIIVVVAVLKYLPLSGRFVPKHILHTGIALLAGGIWELYSSLHLQVTSLELMPGLIIMGVGSGLFVSYITGLTYSTALVDEKPEGSGIYNPIQNLGGSLGRAILGTLLVFFASRDIVDSILQHLGKTLAPAQRGQLIAELQEMIQTLSREEIATVLANKVSPSLYPEMRSTVLEAATSGMKTSLLVALMFTGVCFLLATTLPKYPATRS